MSADNSALWGASAPATSAALSATVGLAFSTDGSYAAVRSGPRPAGWPLSEFDALLPLWDNQPGRWVVGRLCAGDDAGRRFRVARPMARPRRGTTVSGAS